MLSCVKLYCVVLSCFASRWVVLSCVVWFSECVILCCVVLCCVELSCVLLCCVVSCVCQPGMSDRWSWWSV